MESTVLTQFIYNPNFGTSEIWVWDWPAGACLHKIDFYSAICYPRFLDMKHLVLFSATLGEASLHIYNISSLPLDQEVSPNGYFYGPSHPTLHPALVLEFPHLNEFYEITARGFPLISDRIPGRRSIGSATLAYPSATTLGLMLTLQRSRNANTILADYLCYRIFVSASKLLDYTKQHDPKTTTTLPWNDWGEHSTRWFVESFRSCPRYYWISDSRYVLANPPRELSDGRQYLSVVCFHTPTVKRYSDHTSKNYLAMPRSETNAVTEKKVILEGEGLIGGRPAWAILEELAGSTDSSKDMVYVGIVDENAPTITTTGFARPFISRLPYRIATKLRTVPAYSHWLIDGSHIIGTDTVRIFLYLWSVVGLNSFASAA